MSYTILCTKVSKYLFIYFHLLFKIMLVFYIYRATCKNFALLINTSKDYENYRHATNIFLFYNLFLSKGYSDDNVLYLQTEDIQYNPRNVHKGKIYDTETNFFSINNYYRTTISLQYILNILYCNHKLMLDLCENTNLFIYMTGHGGDGFMKILDREYLHKNDLMQALIYLCNRLKNVILFIDTCQASTQINENLLPKNCFVVCSSVKGEPSISYKANREIGCAVVDSLPKLFCDKAKICDENVYLEDFLSDFSYEILGSHIKFFGKRQRIKLCDCFEVSNYDDLRAFKEL